MGELFMLQDSEPQFAITSSAGKMVSSHTGTEIKSDQRDETDAERFQLELDSSGKVSFQTSKSKYFSVSDTGVLCTGDKKGEREKFNVTWMGDRVKVQAFNGKYLT